MKSESARGRRALKHARQPLSSTHGWRVENGRLRIFPTGFRQRGRQLRRCVSYCSIYRAAYRLAPSFAPSGGRVKSLLDPTFKYVPSVETDIRKTFARVRREARRGTPAIPPPHDHAGK